MFIFPGHQPVVDKFLNTKYEENPSDHSGASETLQQSRRETPIPKIKFLIHGGLKRVKLSKYRDRFFHNHYHSVCMRVQNVIY